jgi:hypothetical protein
MTTFSDDFNRADSTTVGNGWVEAAEDWAISSNRLAAPAAGGTGVIVCGTPMATDDNFAQVTIAVAAAVSCGVWCRGDSAFGNGYLWRNDGTSWDLFRNVSGSFTSLATFAGAAANGDVAKVQAIGTTIKAFVNGVERASVTDANITTGKNTGMRCAASASVRFDDFTATDATAGSTVNGTVSQAYGGLGGGLTATREVPATAAQAFGGLTGGVSGIREALGGVAQALGGLSGGVSGTREVPMAVSQTLGGLGGGVAGTRETFATVSFSGGALVGHVTGGTGDELELPNSTVVAKAWLYAIGFDPDRVANELPRRDNWPGPVDGFVTVLPLISNGEAYVPLQHPVIQFDCWGAFGGSTKKPNHGVANDLAERIRAAAESTMWVDVPEVALPPGVMPVWLSSIDVIRGVQRIPDDHYAHYSLDVHIGWIERERLAGVTG